MKNIVCIGSGPANLGNNHLYRFGQIYISVSSLNKNSSCKIYKEAFHKTVIDSKGKDFYTKEELDWSLISTYNNKQSKEGGRNYKKKFALLPTIDHYDDKYENFVICSWRINDAKNDLSHHEFIELCKKVIKASAMNLHSR